MRLFTSLICLLSVLATTATAAEDTRPLKDKAADWLANAKSFIPTAPPSPIDAGAAKVSAKLVEKVNYNNWQRKLAPSAAGPTEWLIYLTGNSSCFGRCGDADLAWNQSVPIIAAAPSAPTLGAVNCDKDKLLCTQWAATVPTIWHIQLPAAPPAGQQPDPTTIRIVYLNVSSEITVADVLKVFNEKTWLTDGEEYTGMLHPFDGLLTKTALIYPFGYMMWIFGTVPNWVFMIGISFASRTIMTRRMKAAPSFQDLPKPKKTN